MFYFTKEACEHLNHVLTLSYGKCMAVVRTVTFCFTSVIHKITQGAQNVKSEYEKVCRYDQRIKTKTAIYTPPTYVGRTV